MSGREEHRQRVVVAAVGMTMDETLGFLAAVGKALTAFEATFAAFLGDEAAA